MPDGLLFLLAAVFSALGAAFFWRRLPAQRTRNDRFIAMTAWRAALVFTLSTLLFFGAAIAELFR